MSYKLGKCKECGGEMMISRRGLCVECGYSRMERALDQQRARKGPAYRRTIKAQKKARKARAKSGSSRRRAP